MQHCFFFKKAKDSGSAFVKMWLCNLDGGGGTLCSKICLSDISVYNLLYSINRQGMRAFSLYVLTYYKFLVKVGVYYILRSSHNDNIFVDWLINWIVIYAVSAMFQFQWILCMWGGLGHRGGSFYIYIAYA